MDVKDFEPKFYILEGHEAVACNVWMWARWFEQTDRTVAREQITPDIRVSTVFLGLDHQFLPGGPPLIFETMIFGGRFDGDQWRYSTWDEAMAGHKRAVMKARRNDKREEKNARRGEHDTDAA